MRRLAAALAAGALLAASAAARPAAAQVGAAAAPLHVAQVLVFRAATMAEVEADLDRLAAAGVDTLFVRVFSNRGDRPLLWDGRSPGKVGVYFRTGAAPVAADLLPGIAAACRRRGLRIFAWMTTRACDWLLEERPELAELRWDAAAGQVVRARTLNIFHPAVRAHLAALYRDLAANDIDGILFQDDLVLRAGEGLSPEAIEAYLEEGGPAVSPAALFADDAGRGETAAFRPATYRDAFWPWAEWKNRRLLGLAEELAIVARSARPGLLVALNLYYETIINPRMALAWYAQSLPAAESRPFDYYSLMSYHRQMASELRFTPEEGIAALGALSRQAAAAVASPAKVVVKIQTLDWETRELLPGPELDRALGAVAPGTSLAVVRGPENPPLDVVARHFRPPSPLGGEGRVRGGR